MARGVLIICIALLATVTRGSEEVEAAERKGVAAVPKLIIDTDLDFDVDDVGAICAANALADNGEVEIIAVVSDDGYAQVIGAASVLNTYYGRAPALGAFEGEFGSTYAGKYVPELVEQFPSPVKNYSSPLVMNNVDLYRSALAKQDNGTVVISSIGFMTNLAALLQSGPDQFSNMTGQELVEAKVKRLAVMGGYYPASPNGPRGMGEFNYACGQNLMGPEDECAGTAQYVMQKWPRSVETIFSGFEVGVNVMTGGVLTNCSNSSNPCREAYILWLGENNDRPSWDPLTTVMAVRGPTAVGCSTTGSGGVNVITDAELGANQWIDDRGSNWSYLLLDDADYAANQINDLLCQPPKH